MNKKEKLQKLIIEAQGILNRIVERFEYFKEKDVKVKTKELKIVARKLNTQLANIVSLDKQSYTMKEIRMADDIVFQLSIYDDICEGYLKGI